MTCRLPSDARTRRSFLAPAAGSSSSAPIRRLDKPGRPWEVARWGRLLAGLSVLFFTALAMLIHPGWLTGVLAVAINMVMTSITDYCPLRRLLLSLGVQEREDLFLPGGTLRPKAPPEEAHESSATGAPGEQRPNPVGRPRVLTLAILAGLHIGCLCAPLAFNGSAVAVAVALWFVSLCFGISIGWHRLLTHRAFKTYAVLRWFFALCGAIALQGRLFQWVGIHRLHHRHSDSPGDPHSPRDGWWHAHFTWGIRYNEHFKQASKYVADLTRDRILRWIDRGGLVLAVAQAAFLYGFGGWPWLVWGLCVRLVFCFHVTWLVNSAAHRWGYRNFTTHDESRNNPWVALFCFGEGWHNNHHAQQRSAAHGMRWWELDPSYGIILLMEKTGLAWEVVKPLRPGQAPAFDDPSMRGSAALRPE